MTGVLEHACAKYEVYEAHYLITIQYTNVTLGQTEIIPILNYSIGVQIK